MSKPKPDTQVTAKITVTIGEQSFEMTVPEAKKLKEQLEAAIPEKEPKWPAYPPERIIERPVYIPVPQRNSFYDHQRLNPYRPNPNEVTCFAGNGPSFFKMLASECAVGLASPTP